jgi:hypothetical protein
MRIPKRTEAPFSADRPRLIGPIRSIRPIGPRTLRPDACRHELAFRAAKGVYFLNWPSGRHGGRVSADLRQPA